MRYSATRTAQEAASPLGKVAEPPRIMAAIANLEEAIGEMDGAILRFEERLAPILDPSPPGGEPPTKKDVSPMIGDRVDDCCTKVRNQCSALCDIMSRLQI